MNYYWLYYVVWFVISYGARQPLLLVGIVLFLVLQRFIPDPSSLLRAFGSLSDLRNQVAVNPSNVTARRDLAVLYIDLRVPSRAIPLLEQALARFPDDADLLYLHGLALHRSGKHEKALESLLRAIELRPGIRYGEAYKAAGEALFELRRYDDAIDAFERFTSINSSDVGAFVLLAKVYARKGDRAKAASNIAEASRTFWQLSGGLQRKAIGDWLGALWARAWVLREPLALGFLVVSVALAAFVTSRAFSILQHVTTSGR